jgi:hypothetical protein
MTLRSLTGLSLKTLIITVILLVALAAWLFAMCGDRETGEVVAINYSDKPVAFGPSAEDSDKVGPRSAVFLRNVFRPSKDDLFYVFDPITGMKLDQASSNVTLQENVGGMTVFVIAYRPGQGVPAR